MVGGDRKAGTSRRGRNCYGACKKSFFSKPGLVRLVLTGSLFVTAVVVCTFSYVLISNLEQELGDYNYASVSRQMVDLTVESMKRMSASALTMALIYATEAPDAYQWPNVALSSFPALSRSLSEGTGFSLMVFQPLVPPDKVASFEEFAYEFFDSNPDFFEGIGQHSFGKGIFAFDLSLNNSDKRYHDTTGYTPFSDRKIILPILQFPDQTSFKSAPGTMFNAHSKADYAPAQDLMFSCVDDAFAKNPNATGYASFPSCPCATDILPVIVGALADANSEPDISDAQFAVAHPVYPLNDATTVVGMVSTVVSLSDLLNNVVPSYLSGLDVVFATDDVAYTFSFVDGKAIFRGRGDKHDRKYSSYGRSHDLLGKEFLFTSNSYTITVYPSTDYFDDYLTDLPLIAALVPAALIVFCYLLFIAYDRLMSWEFSKAQAVSETKRRFVRFISHEVRTPLNIVKLGLKIVEEECEKLQKGLRDIQVAENSAIATASSCQSIRCSSCSSCTLCSSGSRVIVADAAAVCHATTYSNSTSCDLCEALTAIRESLVVLRETAEELTCNTDSAVEVLDDLINYDKIEQGAMRLDCSQVCIDELLSTSIASFRAQASTQNVTLLLQHRGEAKADSAAESDVSVAAYASLCVLGDAHRLLQVLRNLVTNALKFTPPGGEVVVSVEWNTFGLPAADLSQLSLEGEPLDRISARAAGSVIVSVSDSGAGMNTAQLSKLFREGAQFNAKELQAGQGSGLGLFIAKGLVEQHGGSISASSAGPGRGTTFSIELPAFHCEPDTDHEPEHQQIERILAHADRSTITATSVAATVSSPPPYSRAALLGSSSSSSISDNSSSSSQCNGADEKQEAENESIATSAAVFAAHKVEPVVDIALANQDPKGVAFAASSAKLESDSSVDSASIVDRSNIASTFIPFTAAAPTATVSTSPTSSTSIASGTSAAAVLNILMVDDSLPNRRMLGRLLRSRGHHVTEACDGQKAVDAYKANIAAFASAVAVNVVATSTTTTTGDIETINSTTSASTKAATAATQAHQDQSMRPFDCILMDFEMPIMNGPTAVLNIRALGYQGPIIGVTGNVLPEDVNLFMKNGATAVLLKPVRIGDLESLWRFDPQVDKYGK